ncbi:MAG: PD-(D/E)XK nuclease family protein [Gammaproteobacteria bacterium]|nr:PD-(D/E)XK nuclease family protein [Gammaproteobacteria bacterium]
MNDTTTSQISVILDQVRLLKSKYDELAAVTGEQFNVFSILGVEADEVRTHSAFLADLLDPQGSHRQGAAFLKLFLGLDALKSSESGEYKNPETFRVSKEASTDQGQIDILLENEEACIVIENKIYAGDQERQLARYYEAARNRGYLEKRIKLVYLTLDGSSPSDYSLAGLPMERVKCLSYSEDIIKWLEKCMKLEEVQRVSPIREIVFQYRDLLKQLTGQSTNKRLSVELKDILVKPENYKLIPELEEAILALQVHVQLKFWIKLTEIMKCKIDKSGIHDIQEKEASEDNIRSHYTARRYRNYFGTTFKLDSFSWQQTEIALRVAMENDYIFYEFILLSKDGKRESSDNKEFGTLVEKLNSDNSGRRYKFQRGKDIIVWKWPEKDLWFPVKFRVPEAEKFLLDDSEAAVQELVNEIAAAVEQLKKNLNQS